MTTEVGAGVQKSQNLGGGVASPHVQASFLYQLREGDCAPEPVSGQRVLGRTMKYRWRSAAKKSYLIQAINVPLCFRSRNYEGQARNRARRGSRSKAVKLSIVHVIESIESTVQPFRTFKSCEARPP